MDKDINTYIPKKIFGTAAELRYRNQVKKTQVRLAHVLKDQGLKTTEELARKLLIEKRNKNFES